MRSRLITFALLFLTACSSELEHSSPYDTESPLEKQAKASLVGAVALEGETDFSQVSLKLQNDLRTYSIDTEKDGAVRLTGVVPGTYALRIGARYFEATTEQVTLTLGSTYDLGTRRLGALRTSVKGNALAQSLVGKSLVNSGGVLVTLRKTGSIRNAMAAAPFLPQAAGEPAEGSAYATLSAADGAFEITGVPAGVYLVTASGNDLPAVDAGSVTVTGEDGDVTVADITLSPITGLLDIVGAVNGEPSTRYTNDSAVTLQLLGFNAQEMRIGSVTGADPALCVPGSAQTYAVTAPLTLTVEGANTACAVFVAADGRGSEPVHASIVYDQTAPEVAAVSINNGAQYTASAQVTLTLTAVDATSGIAAMTIAETPAFTGAAEQPYVPALVYPLGAGGGLKTVYVKYRDRAGNYTAAVSASVFVSTAAPALASAALQRGDGSAVANGAVVNQGTLWLASAVTADTPLQMQISTNGSYAGVPWQPYSPLAPVLLPLPSTNVPLSINVQARVQDAVGNVLPLVSQNVSVDVVAPAGSVILLTSSPAGSPTVALALSADEPGYAQISTASSFAGAAWFAVQNTNYTLSPGDGTRLLYVRFKDAAGNVSASQIASLVLDTLPPSGVSLALDGGATAVNDASGDVVAVLTAVDASNVTGMKLGNLVAGTCATTLAAAPASAFSSVSVWTLASPGLNVTGTRTVCASVKDGAGNWSSPVSTTVVYDTQAPAFSAAVAGAESIAGRTAKQLVTLSLSAVSGDAAEMMVSNFSTFTGAAWQPVALSLPHLLLAGDGAKTVYLKIKDQAGNESATATPTITLDATGPDAPGLQVADVTGDGFALSSATVELRWSVPADPYLAGFQLERFVQGVDGNFSGRATLAAAQGDYVDDVTLTTGNMHHYRIRAIDDLGNVSAWSMIASGQPVRPVTEATWVRSADDVYQYNLAVPRGIFSINTTYVYEDETGAAHAEPLLANTTAWSRAKPAAMRFNEKLVTRSANQDNSLVQESEIPLQINDRRIIDSENYVGSHTAIARDAAGRLHIAYRYDTYGSLKYAVVDGANVSIQTFFDVSPQYLSLTVDAAGKAHIGYYDWWSGEVKYTTNASGSWVHATVASGLSGVVNGFTSMALDAAGHAHFSYYDATAFKLWYADNVTGAWSRTNVDAALGSGGGYTSLALDALGKAHIAYYDGANGNLKYATNAGGGWAASTLDSAGDVGFDPSLAVDAAGKAHIAYSVMNGDLKYATNAGGVWTYTPVATGISTQYASLALDAGGKAHIAYTDYTNGDLEYATNAGGAWALATMDSAGTVGWHPSITLDATGVLYVSYNDATNGDLRLLTSKEFTRAFSTIESAGYVGWFCTMKMDAADQLHVAYVERNIERLRYATYAGGAWAFSTVDTFGMYGGGYVSLALDANAKVHLAYFDDTTNELRYANNVTGPWAVSVIDTGLGGAGGQNDLAIDRLGNPHVVYYDSITYQLKYAVHTGGVWSTEVAASGSMGSAVSLELDGADKAHISYYASYLHYLTNAGGAWSGGDIDSSNIYMGFYSSLVLDPAGSLHVSYQDASANDLRFAEKIGGVWTPVKVDTEGSVGQFSSLALDAGGRAHIGYYDQTNGNLKYAGNATGKWTASTLDGAGNVGMFSTLAVDSAGEPHVVYYDETNADLKYATRFTGRVAAQGAKVVTTF